MQRVEQLLRQKNYRQALVRLWVLGSNGVVLNRWEQNRAATAQFALDQAAFLADLSNHNLPGLTDSKIKVATLAFVRALDDFLYLNGALTAPALRRSNRVLPMCENGKDYWILPVTLKVRRTASLAKQSGNLSLWFHHHVVVPAKTSGGLDVRVVHTKSHVDDQLAQVSIQPKPELKVWIGHFDDKADVSWTTSTLGNWRTDQVLPSLTRQRSVMTALCDADNAGAHIVVFPEFTLDLAQRQTLIRDLRGRAWKSLVLVVGGSFHEPVGQAVFNTAPLYNFKGGTVLSHNKIQLFGGPATGAEDVAVGDAITLLVSPIGCFTLLICKDFMDAHPRVESLLSEVPVDWVLVPSFGDESTIRSHRDRAKKLAVVTSGTSTIVAQTRNTALPPKPNTGAQEECVRGFAHKAGEKEPGSPVGEEGGLVSFPIK